MKPFRKKKLYRLDEIHAMSQAFGRPMKGMAYAKFALIPFLCFGGFSYLFFHYWWVALICGFIGSLYGWFFLLQKQVKNDYEKDALYERNRFLNNMTQMLTNENMTLIKAFSISSDYAEGELKKKLIDLQNILIDGSDKEVIESFRKLRDFYKSDVQFDQYLEQLAIMFVEGRTPIKSLKDTKDHHNQILIKQDKFIQLKKARKRDFNTMIFYSVGFIAALMFSFTLQKFIDIYAHTPFGMITSSLYLLIIFGIYHSFNKRFFDDSITEVKI
ncbi:hypothetical protein BN2127_JRS3_03675 [Bacillus safensis]|uniref:hypothetical protein n=1 Tax=Bacillus safensis TaxID=561879 RepID=UPI0006A891A0|nr:hypothetical protein [Bacillus safensis]CUB23997.1 hypothetical protein BN2127_JRS3_03675 [Bacillus safensis]